MNKEYRLKARCASHTTGGKTYVAGDVIKSSVNLVDRYPAKFEEVIEQNQPKQKPVAIQNPKQEKPKIVMEDNKPEKVDSEKTTEKELSEEVEFPEAVEAGLNVVQKGAWYNVTDPDDGDKQLNEKGLRKGDVAKFINDYVNGVE